MKEKVLFILHIPPPVNGAALVGKFIKESKVINTTFETQFINLTTSFKLDNIGKGGFHKLLIVKRILTNIYKALRKTEYDLCYMTLTAKGFGFYKDFLIVILLKLFRKNIVYHFHNKGVKKNSAKTINDLLYRFVFKNTSSIVLSPSLSYDIEKYVHRDNIYICPNGIPNIELRRNIDTPVFQEKTCMLLFLSNMMEEKGVMLLLEACRNLRMKNLNFECHFIGAWSDITEDNFIKKVENYELEKYVFAHGKKYGKEKLHYFQNSDVFVFPTYYNNECFPLVILEAMQLSLPVVSTPEGGIADLVVDGKTGILTKQKDVNALTSQLQLLIENEPLRKELGAAGRNRFKQLYTLSIFEKSLCDILKKISEQPV